MRLHSLWRIFHNYTNSEPTHIQPDEVIALVTPPIEGIIVLSILFTCLQVFVLDCPLPIVQ